VSSALLLATPIAALFALLAHRDARSGPGSVLAPETAMRVRNVFVALAIVAGSVGMSLKIGGF
jgi:hypothetical protein